MCLLLLSCIVLHGFEGSAWARNLGLPLSDLRLLCGSPMAKVESRKTFTQLYKHEDVSFNVKT